MEPPPERGASRCPWIIGTSYAALDMAEDRERFSSLLRDLNIPYPKFGAVNNAEEAVKLSRELGFPLLVRRCGNPWVGCAQEREGFRLPARRNPLGVAGAMTSG